MKMEITKTRSVKTTLAESIIMNALGKDLMYLFIECPDRGRSIVLIVMTFMFSVE